MPPEPFDLTNAQTFLAERHSVRAYHSDPVPQTLIEEVLALAARAPSGCNTQPWKVRVVRGARKEALSARIIAALRAGAPAEGPMDYPVFPAQEFEPYRTRRRQLAHEMYALLGVGRADQAARARHFEDNYAFFGAPVGLFFCIDRGLTVGSWLDVGMFIQNVALAAQAHGLGSCIQQAFCFYPHTVAQALELPESDMVLCAMSLGYPAEQAVVNSLMSARAEVASFTTFVD